MPRFFARAGKSDFLSPPHLRKELADVQIYLMLLSNRLGVDLLDAVQDKVEENERKYPADRARGRSDKYNRL